MTPAARTAVERAAAQLVDAMATAQGALRALFRVLDEATGAEAAPPSSAPPPAAEPAKPSARVVRRFEHNGAMLTIMELAALAGCTEPVMRSRLLVGKKSPAEAVAMGPGDRFRKRPESGNFTPGPRPKTGAQHGRKVSAEAETNLRPIPNGRPTIVTLAGVDPRKLAPPEPVLNPNNVQAEPAKPIPDRFAVDPATVERTFSALKPGQYLPSDSVTARRLGANAAEPASEERAP